MDSNTTSPHFEGEGRSARFLRLQEAILPPYASLLCHSESAYQPCLNGIPNRVFMKLKLFFFFFFRRPRPGPGTAMVSAMAERHQDT